MRAAHLLLVFLGRCQRQAGSLRRLARERQVLEFTLRELAHGLKAFMG